MFILALGAVFFFCFFAYFVVLTVPRRCFFCGSFLLFICYVGLFYAVLSVPCSLVITCWERADLLALLCVEFSCVLSLFQIVFPDSCGIPLYFGYSSVLIH